MPLSLVRWMPALLFLILVCCPAAARDLRDPQFMQQAQQGFKHIFNQDYDEARRTFVALERAHPHHPAPPLYLAAIYWLEEMIHRQDLSLNRFAAPAYFSAKTNLAMPEEERQEFFQALQRCERRAEEILKTSPKNRDARYFRGSAYGLRASFAITIDHSVREAFGSGRKAYASARDLIEEDPAYYDAYMSAGVYEYVVGSIPWYWRWMAFVVGLRGDKRLGLNAVRLAAEKGEFVRNEAELILMVLEVFERRYDSALNIARDLRRRFPRSYLFALNVAQVLQLGKKREDATRAFLEVETLAEAGQPNFNALPLQSFRFNMGTQLMYMEKHDLAAERFRRCLADPHTGAREKALAHLNLGKILSWQRQPDAAAREFRTVLSLEDFDRSHSRARELLQKLRHDPASGKRSPPESASE